MTTAKKPATRQKTIDLPIAEDGSTPRVIILGRGTLTGSMVEGPDGKKEPSRKLEALRIRKRTMERVRSLVAGPAYLAVDLLLQRACDLLEKNEGIEVVRAESMES
ncbi:hypothetical protein [Rhodoferax sp. PAMC 29310]|jgi:hypothetical protein|uniref:hypothetical protein n=1 Tax=Rhodoferax sp. PAMC 29310 TaxID=2822760 RepID=UPI001B31999C|nr:hypothetical protein [Rhodoferax sp. PAMC 29310]